MLSGTRKGWQALDVATALPRPRASVATSRLRRVILSRGFRPRQLAVKDRDIDCGVEPVEPPGAGRERAHSESAVAPDDGRGLERRSQALTHDFAGVVDVPGQGGTSARQHDQLGHSIVLPHTGLERSQGAPALADDLAALVDGSRNAVSAAKIGDRAVPPQRRMRVAEPSN